MKKLLSAVVATAVVTLAFQSCDYFKHGGSGEATDSLEVEDSLQFCTASYQDTLRFEGDSMTENTVVEQDMQVDFPVPESEGPLADSIRVWLVAQVQSHYESEQASEGEVHSVNHLRVYKVGEEQEFVEAYAREGMKLMTDFAKQGIAEGFFASQSNDYKASVCLVTDKFVTYETGYYVYTGGAHGGFISGGVTFRSSDGCKMGWNLIDPAKYDVFIAHVKKDLCRYFDFEHEGKQPISEEALMEELQLWDDPDTPENELKYGLPLPAAPPCIVRDGISYVYQQYEIAAYACGLPSGVIPFDVIKDCLTPEALELCGLE